MGMIEGMIKGKLDDVKKKVEKIDLNHNGRPDVIEAKEMLEGLAEKFAPMLLKMSPADWEATAEKVNEFFFHGKFSKDEMQEIFKGLAELYKAEQLLEGLAKELPNKVL